MIFAIVEWWLIVNLGIMALFFGRAEKRIRYHNNILPFQRPQS